jgi:hypothetical protein
MAAGLTTYACYSVKGRGIVAELLEAVEARHRVKGKVNVKGEKVNVKGEGKKVKGEKGKVKGEK